MRFPLPGRKTHEHLERVEARVDEQLRATTAQQAALSTVTQRLGDLERQISAMAAAVDARVKSVSASVDRLTPGLVAAMEASRASQGDGGTDKRLHRQLKRMMGLVARLGGAFDASIDEAFLDSAEPLVKSRRTMLGYDRLYTLWQAARNAAPLGLPVVEVGSFRGGSAALLAEALRSVPGGPREVHVVDTFEGHIDATFSAHDSEDHRGKFRDTNYEDVRAFLAVYPGVQVHQGDASAVIAGWPERRYALVHLDVDLYGPTLDCLDYFGPRLTPGGVFVMDDYESPTCPGVSVAVQEYIARVPGFQTWRLQDEQMLLIKAAVQE